MKSLKTQNGISFWSILILAPLIGFYIFLGIKVGPEYLNSLNVQNAIDGVANEKRTIKPSKKVMRTSIRKRLDVSYITYLKNEHIIFKEKKDGLYIMAIYDREVHLFANIFVTMKFNQQTRVRDPGS